MSACVPGWTSPGAGGLLPAGWVVRGWSARGSCWGCRGQGWGNWGRFCFRNWDFGGGGGGGGGVGGGEVERLGVEGELGFQGGDDRFGAAEAVGFFLELQQGMR